MMSGNIGATRKNITEYMNAQYGATPEYLWRAFPFYAVFRRADNKKWYGVIMNVPSNKLGLTGDGLVDVLDIKCNAVTRELFKNKHGFLPAYHMNKDNWISVLLDGCVDKNLIYGLIDESYRLAGTKKR